MAKTPKPKTVRVVCEVCGLDWPAHGEKPTLEDCVRLLKAELAKRPSVPYVYATGQGISGYIRPQQAQ